MKIQKATKKSLLPIGIILVVLIVGSIGAYFYFLKKNQDTADSNADSTSKINYDPPTQQEIEASQDAKKNNSNQSTEGSTDSKQSNGKRSVSVGIAFADHDSSEKAVDIRAFTPDAIEGDGTCTATLTQGSKTVKQSSEAFIDSSSSQCEPILIPASKFNTGGVWKLSVSYNSAKSSGTSPTMEVTLDL